jgi:hypothetical protein
VCAAHHVLDHFLWIAGSPPVVVLGCLVKRFLSAGTGHTEVPAIHISNYFRSLLLKGAERQPTTPARGAPGQWSALTGSALSCDGQRRPSKNNLGTVVA